jgi:hypothetical protein
MISWFFLLYFGGRLFTERYKEIEALPPDAPISMGQYLSFPGVLLGIYGLYRAFKRKEPTGWVEPGDEREDEDDQDQDEDEDEDEDEDDDENEKSSPDKQADDVRDEDEDDEDDEDDDEAAKKPAGDPDVDAEFQDGKLKKQRQP